MTVPPLGISVLRPVERPKQEAKPKKTTTRKTTKKKE